MNTCGQKRRRSPSGRASYVPCPPRPCVRAPVPPLTLSPVIVVVLLASRSFFPLSLFLSPQLLDPEDVPPGVKKERKNLPYVVYWFGEHNMSWVKAADIVPFDDPRTAKYKENALVKKLWKEIQKDIAEWAPSRHMAGAAGSAASGASADAAAEPAASEDEEEGDESDVANDLIPAADAARKKKAKAKAKAKRASKKPSSAASRKRQRAAADESDDGDDDEAPETDSRVRKLARIDPSLHSAFLAVAAVRATLDSRAAELAAGDVAAAHAALDAIETLDCANATALLTSGIGHVLAFLAAHGDASVAARGAALQAATRERLAAQLEAPQTRTIAERLVGESLV